MTTSSSDKRLVDRRGRGDKGSTAALPPELLSSTSAGEARVGMRMSARGVSEATGPVVVVGSATAEPLSGHPTTPWVAGEGVRDNVWRLTPRLATQVRLGRTGL